MAVKDVLIRKQFNGVQVFSLQDAARIINVSYCTICRYFSDNADDFIDGYDYFIISTSALTNALSYRFRQYEDMLPQYDVDYTEDGYLELKYGRCYGILLSNGSGLIALTIDGVLKMKSIIYDFQKYKNMSHKSIMEHLTPDDEIYEIASSLEPPLYTTNSVVGKLYRGVKIYTMQDIKIIYGYYQTNAIYNNFNRHKNLFIDGVDYFYIRRNDDRPYIINCSRDTKPDYATLIDDKYVLLPTNGETTKFINGKELLVLTDSGVDKLMLFKRNTTKLKTNIRNHASMRTNTVEVVESTTNTTKVSTNISSIDSTIDKYIYAIAAIKLGSVPIPSVDSNGKLYYATNEDNTISEEFNAKVQEIQDKIKSIFGQVDDSNLNYVLNFLRTM